MVQKHTVEFNQVAMANSEGSEVMLNRVMTKDNVGVAVLLEVNKDVFSDGETILTAGDGMEPSFSARLAYSVTSCFAFLLDSSAF